MKIIPTSIPGVLIVEPVLFTDRRGYFMESYNKKKFAAQGIDIHFVQDNQSKSEYGVIRGLHYQLNPFAQTKLVRVLEGSIYDVAVDIRHGSPTFGQWIGVELSAENNRQLLVPKGFAHGFSVLSPVATVFYKCDNVYNPDAERGILFSDPMLNISWQIAKGKEVISGKDKNHPVLEKAEINFIFEK